MKAKYLLMTVFLASACVMRAATNDMTALLQRGLFEEEANHNLEAAMQAYQSAIAEHDKDRKLVATAVFRLGECLRKQGKTNEAALQYDRVMREYSEQETLVKLSAAILGGKARPANGVAAAPEATPELKALESAYQEIAPKAFAARALNDRLNRLTNVSDRIGFFTTIRPDETLVALVQAKANREVKLGTASRTFGSNHPEFKAAEGEVKDTIDQINNRVQALVWAAKNEAESLTEQEARLRKEIAATRQSPPAGQLAAEVQNATASSNAEEDAQIRSIKVLIQNSPDLINAAKANSSEGTLLKQAAEKGHLRVAEFLLANGAEIDAGSQGDSPLVAAAGNGHKAMVELLLAKGANPNGNGNSGSVVWSPLHQAVRNGYKGVAEVLLAHKADVNRKNNKDETPLHLAAEAGNKPIVEMLIAAGAQIDPKDLFRRTPLYRAVERQQIEVSQLLISRKADINVAPDKGITPLHWAVQAGSVEIVRVLLAGGANIEAYSSDTIEKGPSPLSWAIEAQKLDLVNLLLDNHANPNTSFTWIPDQVGVQPRSSRNNITPLLMAIMHCGKEPKIVESLLAHGAEANGKSSSASNIPILVAIQAQNNDALQMLIRHKADLSVKPGIETAYITAVRNGNFQAVEILSDAGADINAYENADNTALHYAVSSVNPKMVSLLISRKANVNALNGAGQPPLSLTKRDFNNYSNPGEMRDSNDEIKALLIKAGADVNYERAGQVVIKAMSSDVLHPVFYKGTNSFNRHSLADLIAEDYSSKRRGSPGSPDIYGNVQFPDFANLSINRLQPDGSSKTIRVDATALLNAPSKSNDLVLEWGDIVTIPELDHRVGAMWTELPIDPAVKLIDYLSCKVEVVVKGEHNSVILIPSLKDNPRYSYVLPKNDTNIFVTGFELGNTINQSGLLRVSSDLTRIKVMRHDPDGSAREYVINEDPSVRNYRYDLWLHDGDVIEIPERDPNTPAPSAVNTSEATPRPGGVPQLRPSRPPQLIPNSAPGR